MPHSSKVKARLCKVGVSQRAVLFVADTEAGTAPARDPSVAMFVTTLLVVMPALNATIEPLSMVH
jgi:hypothetical protein